MQITLKSPKLNFELIHDRFREVHNYFLSKRQKQALDVPISVSLTTFKRLSKTAKYALWKDLPVDLAKDAIRRATYMSRMGDGSYCLYPWSDYFIYSPVKSGRAFGQSFADKPGRKLIGVQLFNKTNKIVKVYEQTRTL